MSGVGLGANVLTRHALAYPERVEAMMLVNTCTTKAGWVEWGCQVTLASHWSILLILVSHWSILVSHWLIFRLGMRTGARQ